MLYSRMVLKRRLLNIHLGSANDGATILWILQAKVGRYSHVLNAFTPFKCKIGMVAPQSRTVQGWEAKWGFRELCSLTPVHTYSMYIVIFSFSI